MKTENSFSYQQLCFCRVNNTVNSAKTKKELRY